MAMRCILPLIFSLLLSGTKQEEPGVKARLTLKGLQYGWQVALEELHNILPYRHIPDVNGSVRVFNLVTAHYSVTKLQIKKLDLSDSKVVYVPDNGTKVVVNNGQIVITGHLKISTFYYSTATDFEVSTSGLSFTGKLGVTSDDKGHGGIWNEGCNSNVGYVKIRFHGGSGLLLRIAKALINKYVYNAFCTKLCSEFDKMVEKMETKLKNLPVVLYVDSVSSLEYQLVDLPLIKEQSLDLSFKGQFIGHSQRWDPPGYPVNLVLPEADSHMALLALSEFSANSAGYVHYMSGFLRYNVTDDKIRKDCPIRLTTTSLALYAPEITTRFPDSPPLLLHVSAHSPPTVSCQPDTLTVNTSVDMQLYAMYPEKPLIPIFQIKADMETQAVILLSETSLGLSLSTQDCSLTLVKTDIGLVKVETLGTDLCFDLKMFEVFHLNDKLKNLVPFPTQQGRLQNPVVRVLKGYLMIMTDFEVYTGSTPPAWCPIHGDSE